MQRIADGAWIGKLDAEVTARGVATNVGYLLRAGVLGPGVCDRGRGARSASTCGATASCASTPPSRVGNEASCRVLEHAGFVRERVLVGNDTLRGVPVDDIEYVRR